MKIQVSKDCSMKLKLRFVLCSSLWNCTAINSPHSMGELPTRWNLS